MQYVRVLCVFNEILSGISFSKFQNIKINYIYKHVIRIHNWIILRRSIYLPKSVAAKRTSHKISA